MATKRQYGYYLKGNNLAIVEVDLATTTQTINSEDYGKYKSPSTAIADGIEIQYSYIPEYSLDTARNVGYSFTGDENETNTSIYFPCYGDINGYLTLFFPKITSSTSANLDLSDLSADANIVIHNHPQFNGVHKIKQASASGYIQTHTRWGSGLGKAEMDDSAAGALTYEEDDDSITATGVRDIFNSLSAGDYIFIAEADTQLQNKGLFKVASINSTASNGILKVDTQYYVDVTASIKGTLASHASAIADQTDTTQNWMANKVLLCEGAYVDVAGVNILQDENFDLDLPRYLANAIVYYLKAKVFEDIMDIEKKEYFMREFKRQVEKFQSTRRVGTYRAIGFGMTR